MTKTLWIVLTCLFFVNSCKVGPNYIRPPAPLPETIAPKLLGLKTIATKTQLGEAQHFDNNKELPAKWWTLFHSKPLNSLVISALKHNPTVAAAQAALCASLENVYAHVGAYYPFVGISALPSRQQTAGVLQSALANNAYISSLYTGQVFVSYTPDVFGGIHRQVESLSAIAQYQRFQLEATYLTLSSNVVLAAIQEASIHGQILATERIIHRQKQILTIFQQRLRLGDVSLATIATQEAALAASEAALPPLEKQLALQRNLLNSLAGRFPDDTRTSEFHLDSLRLPTKLPLSLPTALIEQRPDIRAAEEQMHAANALIGVAIANRLPNFTIGFTNAGTAALSLSTLFQSNTQFWSLAGIITQPIFAGGTLLHNQRFAEQNYKQAAAQYRSTIINAFQNVSDTLKALRFDAISLRTANNASRAALKSLHIAQNQHKLGDTDLLTLLLDEQLYHQAQLNLIQAEANRLSDTVALFQALGGGWWNKQLRSG